MVFELENIRSSAEKSLIMGFILINLSEAIREKYQMDGKFQHITLVEEAHRLLSKYQSGDSPSKKQSVEMFSDMLAEIRKYGECLIIADQIPNKLTPDVLKNTNTKIIHRIFAADDKEAIGNTIMLKDEQRSSCPISPLDVRFILQLVQIRQSRSRSIGKRTLLNRRRQMPKCETAFSHIIGSITKEACTRGWSCLIRSRQRNSLPRFGKWIPNCSENGAMNCPPVRA